MKTVIKLLVFVMTTVGLAQSTNLNEDNQEKRLRSMK